MFFQLHFIMNQKPGDGDGVQSNKIRGSQRVSVQDMAAEAEFCVSKGDHATGIAVKAVHDVFHIKSVKIRVKLFDEKRRQIGDLDDLLEGTVVDVQFVNHVCHSCRSFHNECGPDQICDVEAAGHGNEAQFPVYTLCSGALGNNKITR